MTRPTVLTSSVKFLRSGLSRVVALGCFSIFWEVCNFYGSDRFAPGGGRGGGGVKIGP